MRALIWCCWDHGRSWNAPSSVLLRCSGSLAGRGGRRCGGVRGVGDNLAHPIENDTQDNQNDYDSPNEGVAAPCTSAVSTSGGRARLGYPNAVVSARHKSMLLSLLPLRKPMCSWFDVSATKWARQLSYPQLFQDQPPHTAAPTRERSDYDPDQRRCGGGGTSPFSIFNAHNEGGVSCNAPAPEPRKTWMEAAAEP